ncbi:CG15695 [Drosophila busckii]|uniref:CG15695 n=1 Tax=Drosophila busckii TaxID=30019 RepID=A0A0M4EF31_DROBS|nr:uncharacterized protein LOC108601445 [Drosophila busckii]ALC46716.1 CG15695 [Drosophila busckii]
MPAVNPYTKDVLKIYKKKSYTSCDKSKSFIAVVYDRSTQNYSLHISERNLKCCYKQIKRTGSGNKADEEYKLLPCKEFPQDFVVPRQVDAILTECRRSKSRAIVQRDAFSFVQANRVVNKTVPKPSKRRPNVLLWGMDSISRMNFERTMPIMHKYLKDKQWFELQGYNKMADNTFPNLMALLTGFNYSRSEDVCNPYKVGALDSCPLLWKDYKRQGYMTAYAEDWGRFSTFNYKKRGFLKPPTDFYAHPHVLAIEHELKIVIDTGIPYCVGRRHYAEYIYDMALQFTEVYKNHSTFGMFWANSFSHNNFALPSSMDSKILEYMQKLNQTGTFDSSIVIFFSDHGMRFGPLRRLESGFLEERMPIMYIWLPLWFRAEYPEFVRALKLNRNRLTSPYDIHATLRHILDLEQPLAQLPRPEGCPACHSVFYEITKERDCPMAGIDGHWCTCLHFERLPNDDSTSKIIAGQLVAAINDYIVQRNLTDICHTLNLTNIELVQRTKKFGTQKSEVYLIRYETAPFNSIFEASTDWSPTSRKISINVPDISRLDPYSQLSMCVEGNVDKKFCICNDVEEVSAGTLL